MKKIVVFTGSGVSAESGLRTFRDGNGLWEEYRVTDVATPEAWEKDPSLVQRFYNERRRQVLEAQPNAAHFAIADLQKNYEVVVITQNIDNLHERAGSEKIIHLHGEITKCRSSRYPHFIYDVDGWEIPAGATCEKGAPLRPHIVWFGEAVPMMETAIHEVTSAESFIVVGTSLEVYPAASLIHYVNPGVMKYFIDPAASLLPGIKNLEVIRDKAGNAVPELVKRLLSEA